VSRLYPGNAHDQHLLERAAAGDPVAFTAPTVMEISRGLALAAASRSSMAAALAWFTRLVGSDLVVVLPMDAAAAVIAGRLRAAQAIPPTGARRSGPRPEQRTAWVLDLQIAACAYSHGYELATDNQRDMTAARDLIAELYPSAPPLGVEPAPVL
jgi:predicted nucleic acid-binding protein